MMYDFALTKQLYSIIYIIYDLPAMFDPLLLVLCTAVLSWLQLPA